MLCKKCKKEIPDESKFCNHCGTKQVRERSARKRGNGQGTVYKDKNGKWIWTHPTRPILVEDVRNEKFIDKKRNTEFGKLIDGTTYSGYSIDNKFLLDNDTFVEKKSPKARYYFTFVYKDNKFGVWADFTAGMMYVSKQIDPSFPLIYSITMKDHQPNMMFLKNKNRSNHFKVFLEAYQMGTLRFESINIKNICYEVIKLALSC